MYVILITPIIKLELIKNNVGQKWNSDNIHEYFQVHDRKPFIDLPWSDLFGDASQLLVEATMVNISNRKMVFHFCYCYSDNKTLLTKLPSIDIRTALLQNICTSSMCPYFWHPNAVPRNWASISDTPAILISDSELIRTTFISVLAINPVFLMLSITIHLSLVIFGSRSLALNTSRYAGYGPCLDKQSPRVFAFFTAPCGTRGL